MPRSRRRALVATALAMVAAVLGLAGCTTAPPRPSLPSPATTGGHPSPAHPNIVFVLTDDLSWDLVKYMPHVKALQQQGMTFTNYTVTDSLCCPSRASIFTGEFPHDTHVLGNTLPTGGFYKFRAEGDDRSTFATSLLKAGYRTAFMGKYLNDYNPAQSRPPFREALFGPYVPPGWSTWDGVGLGRVLGLRLRHRRGQQGRLLRPLPVGLHEHRPAEQGDRVRRECRDASGPVHARSRAVLTALAVHPGSVRRRDVRRHPGAEGTELRHAPPSGARVDEGAAPARRLGWPRSGSGTRCASRPSRASTA